MKETILNLSNMPAEYSIFNSSEKADYILDAYTLIKDIMELTKLERDGFCDVFTLTVNKHFWSNIKVRRHILKDLNLTFEYAPFNFKYGENDHLVTRLIKSFISDTFISTSYYGKNKSGFLLPGFTISENGDINFLVDLTLLDLLVCKNSEVSHLWIAEMFAVSGSYTKKLLALLCNNNTKLEDGFYMDFEALAEILGVKLCKEWIKGPKGYYGKSQFVQLLTRALKEIDEKCKLPVIEMIGKYDQTTNRRTILGYTFKFSYTFKSETL